MAEPVRTLTDLLEGDIVRLETPQLTVRAEVTAHDRDPAETAAEGRRWRHAITFMPIGEDAVEATADRYRIEITPRASGQLAVSDVVAEVFDEDTFSYVGEPRGPLTAIELLGGP